MTLYQNVSTEEVVYLLDNLKRILSLGVITSILRKKLREKLEEFFEVPFICDETNNTPEVVNRREIVATMKGGGLEVVMKGGALGLVCEKDIKFNFNLEVFDWPDFRKALGNVPYYISPFEYNKCMSKLQSLTDKFKESEE